MIEIGNQYKYDDVQNNSGFRKRARLHQSLFRANHLKLHPGEYGNYLTEKDSSMGKNFYEGFEIFDLVKKNRKLGKDLCSNMLRSEHIPLNLFIPFYSNKNFLLNVLNEFFDGTLSTVDTIRIEYSPKPVANYLNDATAFDVFIDYTSVHGTKGAIGIEVKYTERCYKLKKDSKEAGFIKDKNSTYYAVSRASGLYKKQAFDLLPDDCYRQIWRNHILGESMIQSGKHNLQKFTSMMIFPEGNVYQKEKCEEYMKLLVSNNMNFIPVTYEIFFDACRKHLPDMEYGKWLDYLALRYIVS
jgi:hypothetical protein